MTTSMTITNDDKSLSITPTALSRIQSQLTNRGKGDGIRIGVRTAGCSGLAYVLEFVDEPVSTDDMFQFGSVKIFIDTKSLLYLNGLEIDWVKEGLNEGLKFVNPNAKGECGCGESFTI